MKEVPMRPRVILHNQVALDGRIDGFPADLALHYETASRLGFDAHLAGSDTIFDPGRKTPPEGSDAFDPPQEDPADHLPLLVVPDSRGRVRSWHELRKQPYWRGFVALCSDSTPQVYLDYLRARHVGHVVCGEKRVDLRAALIQLHERYGVRSVLVDSGGTLNGVLLRAGLVDEVSVLISPHLVGGTTVRSIFRASAPTSPTGAIRLELTQFERLQGDIVWLHYKVASDVA